MSNKKIKPSINLTKYLDQTLRLERMKQKRLDLPSKLVRNNDEKKVRTLDNHIFRSVANLIYFFEFLNLYPDLINKFGEDIEDLLGFKSGGGSRNPKGEGLVRFIIALLAEGSIGYDDDRRFNFRRRLLKVMQNSINQKVGSIVKTSKDPRGYNDTRFHDMIFQDLQRAAVWTSYLDRLTGHEEEKPKRIFDINIKN
ncbi:MAG: hypothetical protein ACHQ1D_10555 [Nitrososphaerales archaeon]